MSLQAIRDIQYGPFSQYLEVSKVLGGDIYRQSLLVQDTFGSLAKFIEAMQKYRKPLIPHEELYFIEPIITNIAAVRNFAREHDKSVDAYHLTYVSKCITIFEWIKEQRIKAFIDDLEIILKPYQIRIVNYIEELDDMHEKWLAHWDETMESLKLLIATYYKKGTVWIGEESVPPTVLLGDITSTNIMFEHRALIDEINKGEDIMRILKHPEVNNGNVIETEDVITSTIEKAQNKWKLHNKKKQSLIITTADLEDQISVTNCEDCTIVIENKIHSVFMHNCKAITILIRSVFSQVEVSECENCRLHFFTEVPKINIKLCKNTAVYLSEKSKDAYILTKKCSATIVNMPFASGLLQSFKIPEEFVSVMIPNKGIETTPLQHED